MNLTENTSLFGQSIVLVNSAFVIFATIGILIIIGLVFHYKRRLKDATALISIIILLLSIPIGISFILNKTNLPQQASVEVKIEDLVIKKVDKSTVTILFTTSVPVIAYLQYEDNTSHELRTIVPQYKIAKRIHHEITIDRIGSLGGKVTFMLNSKAYLFNDQPLLIK